MGMATYRGDNTRCIRGRDEGERVVCPKLALDRQFVSVVQRYRFRL